MQLRALSERLFVNILSIKVAECAVIRVGLSIRGTNTDENKLMQRNKSQL